MYIKLNFTEKTKPSCMDLTLFYMLENLAEIVDVLPDGAKANQQTRIPIEPALNDMFGAFNACKYTYYLDCGELTKEDVQKVVDTMNMTCQGKCPMLEADAQYLEGQNMVVFGLQVALDAVKANKDISKEELEKIVKVKSFGELKRHMEESMLRFFSMFSEALPNDNNAQEKNNTPAPK